SVRADLVRIQGRPQEMRMDFLRLDEPRELVLERFTAPVEDPVPGPRGGRVWLFRDVTRQEILKDRLKRRAALEEMLRYLATELISASPESGMVGDALPLLCRAAGGSGAVVWLLDDRQRARPAWQWTHARAPEADAGAPELSREATRALLDTLGSPWDRARVLLKGEVTDPALAGAMGDRHAAAWLVSVIRSPERLLGFLVLEAADEVPVRWERDELRFFSAAASIFGAWVHKEQMFRELKAAREEAESAAAARTDFIALVSHELRTPLNPLVGFTQVLEESCRCDDESRRDMIRRVREAATRLLELVEDLLTLTRLDGRLDSWRKYPVDVGTLVDVARGALERFVEGRSLEISTSFEGESGFIHADGAAVRRALKALLSNAVRFTPDGGRVLHRIVAGSDVVTFEVTDTGPGVAPDRVEDIFSPFVQEQPLLTRRHGGAGLGLTLVRRIAEAHGGSVSVRNGEAGGAIFTLVLPRYAHEEEDTQP
ncbi:MAG: HAMP domain-containing histidine kinase, partial [Deltaproteobacteria bacterium]|nr:HAMP domain-containing histidine kinase [Deltaproteobacteria bacterium]